jgi:NADH-quinone oxidoreductase subunit L
MTIPLVVLAILSVVAGFIGIPEVLGGNHILHSFLEPVFVNSNYRMFSHHLSHSTELTLMGVTIGAVALTIYLAWINFVKKNTVPRADSTIINPVQKTIYNKYYVDELYAALFMKPINWLSEKMHRYIEVNIIDRIVNYIGESVKTSSSYIRLIQTGRIGFYVFAMVIGLILILLFN